MEEDLTSSTTVNEVYVYTFRMQLTVDHVCVSAGAWVVVNDCGEDDGEMTFPEIHIFGPASDKEVKWTEDVERGCSDSVEVVVQVSYREGHIIKDKTFSMAPFELGCANCDLVGIN